MMNKNINLILEGLHDDRILEAMSKEDIQKIDVNSIKPEKKDLDRAEGLKVNGKKFHGDGSPWNVLAGKMAKLIKDPMKLVRRSKAVRMTYGDTYNKNKEADVWSPFREALVNMGFSEDQISEIEGVKVDKSVNKEVKKTVSVDDKPKGWTPFDEGFKSGDKVQIRTDSDGWFGEYEFVRDASDKDFRDLSMNYLKDYKGKKYVVKNVHKGMFFGDLDIVTDKNIRKVTR